MKPIQRIIPYIRSRSSVAEHPPFKRSVVGSNPTGITPTTLKPIFASTPFKLLSVPQADDLRSKDSPRNTVDVHKRENLPKAPVIGHMPKRRAHDCCRNFDLYWQFPLEPEFSIALVGITYFLDFSLTLWIIRFSKSYYPGSYA